MKQLLHCSQPFGFDEAMFAGIVVPARRNNRRDGITGALICRHDLDTAHRRPEPAIDTFYEKVVADDRRGDVHLLLTKTVQAQMFSGGTCLTAHCRR